jgi:hypothetical protein
MSGYYRMHRGWMEHPALGGEREPFCRRAAWAWLIEHANWKAAKVDVGGKTATVERGQLCYSYRYLADAWNWSIGKVQLFLGRLKTDTMIDTSANTGRLVITICNYEKYQAALDAANTAEQAVANTASIRRQYESEEGKKERKDKGRDSCESGESSAHAREGAPEAAAEPVPETGRNVVTLNPGRFPLSPNWQPPQDWLRDAAELGAIDPRLSAIRFRNHWLVKRTPDAVKTTAEWKFAFESWIAQDVLKQKERGYDGRNARYGSQYSGSGAGGSRSERRDPASAVLDRLLAQLP